MKAVILAGGKGTRLSEETATRPKPMVEIGGMPILWHIMKMYAHYGVDEFVICLGHKGGVIKEWFKDQCESGSDLRIDMAKGEVEVIHRRAEPWKIILADTGEESLTGTRLRRIQKYLTPGEAFCMTYGDGVGDIDIRGAILAHAAGVACGQRIATVTVARPEARFGAVELSGDMATAFVEKPKGDGVWINAGFFVLEKEIFDHIPQTDVMWEEGPIKGLALQGKLGVWKHESFWKPMDTLRDKNKLEELWAGGNAPWKTWLD